ncbi:hypothetical protein AGMMS49992_04510 [Clostridia bacterium]|nr:hypothetical protein AGMMS49992_04510 [Clostridia bacterium]
MSGVNIEVGELELVHGNGTLAQCVRLTLEAVVFPKRGQVTAGGGLRMRKTPKTNGEYMLTILPGAIIDITAAVDGWYQTHWANASGQTFTGWVSSEYYLQGYIFAK